jgi:hypothetical protein
MFRYTSSKGDRRIRVHTVALSNTTTIGNLYKNADLDTILNVYARQGMLFFILFYLILVVHA